MPTTSDIRFCFHCGAKLQPNAKFCAECGADLRALSGGARPAQQTRITPGQILKVGAVSLLLFGAASAVTLGSNIGTKPTTTYENTVAKKAETDPAIEKLKADAAASPNDITAQRRFASALVDSLEASENPSQQTVFDLIEVLQTILKLDPKDPQALVTMADISFNQKVFGKAVDFYKRYLEVQPDDLSARARFASAMTFTGAYDDAIAELQKVLAKEPQNFQASAYLSIAYAQKGDKQKAKELGEKVLKMAPSDEARARFQAFMDSLDKSDGAPGPHGPQAMNPRGNVPTAAPEQHAHGTADTVDELVRTNPIAGPKFARSETKGTSITLFFNEFPMQAMPPFAKDKFLGPIREVAKKQGLTEVRFVDAATGAEMEKLDLSK